MSFGLNTGIYYGDGFIAGGTAAGGSSISRSTTAADINRIARNTASGYSMQLGVIDSYFRQGDVDKALALFEELQYEIQAENSNGLDSVTYSQAASVLSQAYEQMTGANINAQIEAKTSGAFASGFLQGIPLVGLLCEDVTTQEANAKLMGNKVSVMDKVKEYAGAAISGAATGAGIGACSFIPFGPVVGAIGGAVVGIAQTALKDLF